MDRKTLITISTGIVIAGLFLAGLVFFKKDQGGGDLKKNKQETRQVVSPKPEPRKLSEKEKMKTMAENFAGSYYSYTWGEFGMIEGLYYYMSIGMKEREMIKAEGMKKEIKNQPRRYFTVRAKVIDSDFIEYQESKASLNINLEIKEIDGAMISRDTMVLVDANGDLYNGDFNDLLKKVFNKKVRIDLVRVGEEWKIDRIGN